MGKSKSPGFDMQPQTRSLEPLWRAELRDSVAMLAWAPTGYTLPCLGAATFSGEVLLFEAHSPRVLQALPGHSQGALCLAFQPMGACLATGGQDGEIQIYDINRSQSRRFKANPEDPKSAPVSHLVWSSDGHVLASSCGRSLRFWSAQGELLSELPEHTSTITALCYSEAFRGFFSACYGSIRFTARGSLELERELWFRTSMLSLAPSPCGRFIAAGTQDPIVRVWDWNNAFEAVNLEGYSGKTPVLSFSDETLILATASGSSAVLWSLAFGDLRNAPHAALSGHTRRVSGLTFLTGGKALLSSSLDGQLRLFELTGAGTEASTALNLGSAPHLLSLSPDCKHGLAAGTDASLHCVRLDS